MHVRLSNLLAELRSSYWFIPSLMSAGAFALSSLTVRLDERLDFVSLALPFIYLSQPDGARTVLSTVAGSMLSVASLTFSIVMVVLTMASSQFGPRLLDNFMRDRGNQVVLGSFISTFLYCLLVLRTVRGGGTVLDSAAFVPQLSLTVALALAVVNLGAFVYFIHHTTESIQVANVISRISDDLNRKILTDFEAASLFPAAIGGPGEVDETRLPTGFHEDKAGLPASKGGYLRAVDEKGLLHLAEKHGAVFYLPHRPGTYLMRGEALVEVFPGEVLEGCCEEVAAKFNLGNHRTQVQDLDFLFDQLLELALRALSPGVNDPFTATMCVDRLAENLSLLAGRELPSPYRLGEDAQLRVVVPSLNVHELVKHLLGPIRSYAKADYLTLNHLLNALERMSAASRDPVFRQTLSEEADTVRREAKGNVSAADYERLTAHAFVGERRQG